MPPPVRLCRFNFVLILLNVRRRLHGWRGVIKRPLHGTRLTRLTCKCYQLQAISSRL